MAWQLNVELTYTNQPQIEEWSKFSLGITVNISGPLQFFLWL